MPRAATDVMQSVIFSAVLDAVAALKAASKGLPNTLLRDIQSLHPNTTFADLPRELQAAITASVRTAFTQLLKEGYAVAPKSEQTSRPIDRVPERDRRPPHVRGSGAPRGPRGPGRGPRPGGRPGGGKPRG